MRCSSPSAKETIPSFPFLITISTALYKYNLDIAICPSCWSSPKRFTFFSVRNKVDSAIYTSFKILAAAINNC